MLKRCNAMLLAALIFCLAAKRLQFQQKTVSAISVGLEKFSISPGRKMKMGKPFLLSPKIKSAIPWNELIVSWECGCAGRNFF